ncbi:ribosomal-processing cysteine protease Prp [Spiroplasma endosymbiont of Amphibalanus improvisus]|uniref:ribosomal-processing cysteine protease Prp n=1 Tax=Spiroplasma endosymbiont of Amphibalanus improvisus TaxID=3066327 RepID=UPI00313DB357
MVKIDIVKKQGLFHSFLIKGHANSNELGKDLVCSGLTAITTGFMNSLDNLFPKQTKLLAKQGYVLIKILVNSDNIQLSSKIFYYQLLTIYQQNKQFINWKEFEE